MAVRRRRLSKTKENKIKPPPHKASAENQFLRFLFYFVFFGFILFFKARFSGRMDSMATLPVLNALL